MFDFHASPCFLIQNCGNIFEERPGMDRELAQRECEDDGGR